MATDRGSGGRRGYKSRSTGVQEYRRMRGREGARAEGRKDEGQRVSWGRVKVFRAIALSNWCAAVTQLTVFRNRCAETREGKLADV